MNFTLHQHEQLQKIHGFAYISKAIVALSREREKSVVHSILDEKTTTRSYKKLKTELNTLFNNASLKLFDIMWYDVMTQNVPEFLSQFLDDEQYIYKLVTTKESLDSEELNNIRKASARLHEKSSLFFDYLGTLRPEAKSLFKQAEIEFKEAITYIKYGWNFFKRITVDIFSSIHEIQRIITMIMMLAISNVTQGSIMIIEMMKLTSEPTMKSAICSDKFAIWVVDLMNQVLYRSHKDTKKQHMLFLSRNVYVYKSLLSELKQSIPNPNTIPIQHQMVESLFKKVASDNKSSIEWVQGKLNWLENTLDKYPRGHSIWINTIIKSSAQLVTTVASPIISTLQRMDLFVKKTSSSYTGILGHIISGKIPEKYRKEVEELNTAILQEDKNHINHAEDIWIAQNIKDLDDKTVYNDRIQLFDAIASGLNSDPTVDIKQLEKITRNIFGRSIYDMMLVDTMIDQISTDLLGKIMKDIDPTIFDMLISEPYNIGEGDDDDDEPIEEWRKQFIGKTDKELEEELEKTYDRIRKARQATQKLIGSINRAGSDLTQIQSGEETQIVLTGDIQFTSTVIQQIDFVKQKIQAYVAKLLQNESQILDDLPEEIKNMSFEELENDVRKSLSKENYESLISGDLSLYVILNDVEDLIGGVTGVHRLEEKARLIFDELTTRDDEKQQTADIQSERRKTTASFVYSSVFVILLLFWYYNTIGNPLELITGTVEAGKNAVFSMGSAVKEVGYLFEDALLFTGDKITDYYNNWGSFGSTQEIILRSNLTEPIIEYTGLTQLGQKVTIAQISDLCHAMEAFDEEATRFGTLAAWALAVKGVGPAVVQAASDIGSGTADLISNTFSSAGSAAVDTLMNRFVESLPEGVTASANTVNDYIIGIAGGTVNVAKAFGTTIRYGGLGAVLLSNISSGVLAPRAEFAHLFTMLANNQARAIGMTARELLLGYGMYAISDLANTAALATLGHYDDSKSFHIAIKNHAGPRFKIHLKRLWQATKVLLMVTFYPVPVLYYGIRALKGVTIGYSVDTAKQIEDNTEPDLKDITERVLSIPELEEAEKARYYKMGATQVKQFLKKFKTPNEQYMLSYITEQGLIQSPVEVEQTKQLYALEYKKEKEKKKKKKKKKPEKQYTSNDLPEDFGDF